MWKMIVVTLGLVWASGAFAQAPPTASQVLPGEGLAVAGPSGEIHLFGEARKVAPMGSLAKLLWLRLEGDEWSALDPVYKCTGTMGTHHCWLAKGHGRVDLAKATQVSCNLAYLSWAQMSGERWKRQLGDGAARARMDEVFGPFLGNRMPPGDTIPAFTPEWVGDGELLQTSPEAMLQWLLDPAQEPLLGRAKRLLLGFLKGNFKEDAWWMKTGTASVPADPDAVSAWVAGSNGQFIAVLHLPRGKGKAEGLARFRALMGISEKE